ncbi:MAG: 50S ribosomal protein L2 [Bacteroidota bacterium]|nr:50S ribosomal protein L2 [Bacteroidota bacterium]
MGLKKLKPTTPGQKFTVLNDYSELTKGVKPEKSLLGTKKRTGGRNNKGKMTVRYRGGGHKKKYRIIDFKRDKFNIPAVVKTIEYDPNRSAYISLLFYKDGEKRYIIAPDKLKVGMTVISGDNVPPEIGNALKLSNIPLGTQVHNIEMHPGKGGELVRSAGGFAQIISREGKHAGIKLPSGEVRKILVNCMATIGSVSNPNNELIKLGKAGRKRWMGIRPRTRGVAMNPVDHPMGGGEGKSSGGHPRSRTGLYAKGKKTRDKNKMSNKHIIKRRKK